MRQWCVCRIKTRQEQYGYDEDHKCGRLEKRPDHREGKMRINKSSATAELARDAENVDFSMDDVRKT